jgi:hypothetical protein
VGLSIPFGSLSTVVVAALLSVPTAAMHLAQVEKVRLKVLRVAVIRPLAIPHPDPRLAVAVRASAGVPTRPRSGTAELRQTVLPSAIREIRDWWAGVRHPALPCAGASLPPSTFQRLSAVIPCIGSAVAGRQPCWLTVAKEVTFSYRRNGVGSKFRSHHGVVWMPCHNRRVVDGPQYAQRGHIG